MAEQSVCCLFCGSTGHLEAHHIAGRSVEPQLTAPLCLADHDDESEGQRLRRSDLAHGRQRTLLDRQAAILREAGHFLVSLGERLAYRSDQLAAFMAALDERCPGWRQWPESNPPEHRP